MATSIPGSPPQAGTSVTVATAAQHVTVPEDLLNKLATHHITINYVVIGVLLLILSFAGVGAWFGLKGYNFLDRLGQSVPVGFS